MNTTIHGFQAHFENLYGLRNLFVNGPFHERASHMHHRIGKLADSKRKKEKMPGRLARAVSYFMSCVNYFNGHLDLELGMLEKFPLHGCRYCGHMPCDCKPETRPDPVYDVIHEKQRSWSLHCWQEHLKRVYGHYNMGKFEKAYMRLSTEFGELGTLNVGGPHTPNNSEGVLVECRREAADVFSWILTLAYIEDIDLESEVVARYTTCPGCNKSSGCDCPLVFLSEDGTQYSQVGTPLFVRGLFGRK